MNQEQRNNSLMLQLKKHFQLEEEPFSEKASFFFEGAQRKHNLEALRHLATFGDMVLFVTGEKGSGKTHLLSRLALESTDVVRTIYIECERALQEGHGRQVMIIQQCLNEMGISLKDERFEESCERLLKVCDSQLALDGRRTLIVFDNADKLPRPQLLALCGFCRDLPEESSLVMLFSGSSALLQGLKLGANLEQNAWLHQVQMKPLSRDEIVDYLAQALNSAGYQDRLELNDQQLTQLVQIGKGLPGRINKIFPSVMLEPGLLKLPLVKSRNISFRVMIGLAAILVFSFLIVAFQHGMFARLMPVFSLESSGKPEPEVVEQPSISIENEQQAARLALLNAELEKQGLRLPDEDKSADKNGDVYSEKPVLQSETEEVEEQVLASEEDLSVMVPPENTEGETKQAESVTKKSNVDVAEQLKDSEITNSQAQQEVIQHEMIEPVTTKSAVMKTESRHESFRSKAWLAAQSEAAYLPQILGSFEEQTALKYIQELGVQKFDVYYLETEHKGRPWFVVFYGIFPDKAAAQKAIKNAPERIRKQNPWLRSVAGVLRSYPAVKN